MPGEGAIRWVVGNKVGHIHRQCLGEVNKVGHMKGGRG